MMRLFAFLALLLSIPAEAGTVSRLYSFEGDTPAQADQVNSELDNIISALNGNLDSTNLAQNAVATGNIASYAVTYVKMGANNYATSDSSLTRYFNSTNETLIDTLSASITPARRPVWVGLQSVPGLPGRVLIQHNSGGATDNAAYINFRRDNATANMVALGVHPSSAISTYTSYPCSAFWFMDVPQYGISHSYTVYARVATSDSGMVRIENCQMAVFEL